MRKTAGFSFIELMLALVIVMSITYVALRQYNSMQLDAQASQMSATIDSLFQGAKHYYQANCRKWSTQEGGTFDPANTSSTSINITPSMLFSEGFLDMKWPPAINNIVNTTAADNGYAITFTLSPVTDRNPTAVYFNWLGTSQNPTQISLTQVGQIYRWMIQISVTIKSSINVAAYKARLGANSSAGQTLTWTRLPSSVSNSLSTNVWPTMSRVKQFTNLYTNDDMYGASNSGFAQGQADFTNGTLGNDYLCSE